MINHPQNTLEGELISKLEEYIEFLANDINKNATFLLAHRITISEEDFKKGEKLRKEISDLKYSINVLSNQPW